MSARTAGMGGVLALAAAALLAAVGWPLLRTLALATGTLTDASPAGLTRITVTSLLLAGAATAIGTALALAAALVARTLPRWPRLGLDVAVGGILLVPPYAVAAAVLAALGRGGWAGGLLPDVHGAAGMVLAMVLAHMAIPYLTIRAAWRAVDPRLVETARLHGGSMREILTLVLLPPLRGPLAVAATLMFVTALSDPSIPAVLRGRVQTLAHTAFIEVIAWGDDGIAAVIACLLALPLLPVLVVLARGRGEERIGRVWLGRHGSPVLALPRSALLTAARLVTAALVTVILALAATAAVTTLAADTALLSPGVRAVVGSTARHTAAALALAVPLGAATAWAAHHGGARLARGLDAVHTVLVLLPSTTLGIAFFLAYRLSTPTPLGTLPALVGGASFASGSAAIVAVFALSTAPMVHLAIRAGRWQLPRSARETAQLLGAGPRRITARLVLPRTGMLVLLAAGAVLLRTMVSVVPVVFVAAPGAPMTSSFALDLLDHAALEQAFALTALVGVLNAAAVAAVAVLLTRGGRRLLR